jgi:hypothetical protein
MYSILYNIGLHEFKNLIYDSAFRADVRTGIMPLPRTLSLRNSFFFLICSIRHLVNKVLPEPGSPSIARIKGKSGLNSSSK